MFVSVQYSEQGWWDLHAVQDSVLFQLVVCGEVIWWWVNEKSNKWELLFQGNRTHRVVSKIKLWLWINMLIQPNSMVQSVTTAKPQRQETETACSTTSIVERINRCPPTHIYLSHFTKILPDKCQLIRGSHPNLCYVKKHTPTKLEVLLSHCYVRHTEGTSLSLNKSFLILHVS